MHAPELISSAREKLGLTQAEVARQCGLNSNEYRDIESYKEEILTNVSLAKMKDICSVLKLDISSLLATLDLKDQLASDVPSHDRALPRHLLIKKYREKRSASQSDVADAIGYEDEAVRLGETDEKFLDTLPINVINDWSKYIGLPLELMLGV